MHLKTHSLRLLFCLFVGLISAAVTLRGEMKQGTAVVKAVTGSASYLDELGFTHPLTVGTVVKEGQTIKTGADSSVALFLDQNGPNVGLDPSSTLKIEKLAYETTALGTKIDTRLDLKEGALFGSVKKLIGASRYEVKMPKAVAHVRGTEFYIDAKSGDVYVTTGLVNVTVTVNAPSNAPGQTVFTKTVAVAAGQVLDIPKDFVNDADFQAKLVAVAYPANQKFTDFTKYTTPGATAGLREDFRGDKTGADIKVKFPPTNTVVSP